MKKLCFIEMEGVLSALDAYAPTAARVKKFLTSLTAFCKKNQIECLLLSAYHESVARTKVCDNKFDAFFYDAHFLCVTEEYIEAKAAPDKELHRTGLKKDKLFLDNYFKQVVMQQIANQKGASARDVLLLGNDIWLDGYYTARFSKADFALFSENLVDRGKPTQPISGLVYYTLEWKTVAPLLESFPAIDMTGLDKYVFETMKAALVGDSFVEAVKKGLVRRAQEQNQNN